MANQLNQEGLPDDALLHIFSFLSIDKLLGVARAVCRRWRDVALNLSLWKDFDLPHQSLTKALLILDVAPCIRNVKLREESKSSLLLGAMFRTACAIEHLTLSFPSADSTDLQTLLCHIVQQQVRLRRLSKLSLEVPSTCAVRIAAAVWHAGLTELSLTVEDDRAIELYMPKPISSLKKLRFVCDTESCLLERFIDAHAATLECVHLPQRASKNVVIMLGACKRLQDLEISGGYCIDALIQCDSLRSVALTFPDDHSIAESKAFFNKASHLKSLLFRFDTHLMENFSTASLLEVLGKSKNSHLEELGICDHQSLEQLPGLLRYGFSSLRSIHVGVIPTPQEVFGMGMHIQLLIFDNDGICLSHGMCSATNGCGLTAYYQAVQDFPQLHVIGLPATHFCDYDTEDCVCCNKGLHLTRSTHPQKGTTCFSLCGHKSELNCNVPLQCANHCAVNHNVPCAIHQWRYAQDTQH